MGQEGQRRTATAGRDAVGNMPNSRQAHDDTRRSNLTIINELSVCRSSPSSALPVARTRTLTPVGHHEPRWCDHIPSPPSHPFSYQRKRNFFANVATPGEYKQVGRAAGDVCECNTSALQRPCIVVYQVVYEGRSKSFEPDYLPLNFRVKKCYWPQNNGFLLVFCEKILSSVYFARYNVLKVVRLTL